MEMMAKKKKKNAFEYGWLHSLLDNSSFRKVRGISYL
jgi:hypothetical protein